MSDFPTDNPLVSIVLPTYKRESVLPYAIRSVLEQTYKQFELIVVDDNSPDNTTAVVNSFDDPRIKYLRNEPNLKLPKALNRGFASANGQYLTWTSDDNMYAPNAIETMVNRLTVGDCDFVYADYYLFSKADADGRPLDILHDKLPDTLQLDKGNHIGACFMYTRRLYKAVGDYDPELFLVEDYDYFMRAAKQFQFCHIAAPLYYFRRDDDTLYSSRFCEVKASDFLARYKNNLITASGVTDTVVKLLLREPASLRGPILKWSYAMICNRSYRLTQLYQKLASAYLRYRFERHVAKLLGKYRERELTFAEAKDTLSGMMKAFADVAYARP